MRRFAISTAVVLAIALAATGCGRKDEKKDHVSVSGSEGKVTIQADDGKSKFEISTNGSLAAKLPSFIGAYPGAKIQSSMHGAGEGGEGGGIVFTTSDTPDTVIAFYKKKAKEAGMAETMNAQTGGTQIFVASAKEGGNGFHVSAATADGKTQVSLFWSEGQ